MKMRMTLGAAFFCVVSFLLFIPQSYADLDCVACHGPNGPHGEGFEGCNACHGFPPLTSQPSSDGLVKYPSPTGGTSPGGHAKHATAEGYSYPCQTCHFGGMTAQGGIIQDPRQLEMGFNIFGIPGGVYGGRTLLAPFTYTAGQGTTITPNGGMTCSSIYCHSNGTSVSTGTVPLFMSPAWTSQGPLACDSCHGYPPAYEQDNPKSNEHFKHGHQTHPCSDCHYTTTNDGTHITDKTKHVNGQYDVAPDPTVGNAFAYTWAEAGGTCSNVSCHGDNHTSPVVWGDERCVYTIASNAGASCFERTFSLVAGEGNTCVLPGVSYLWSFGDGQSSTDAEPSHTYASAGTYTVRVDFRDAGNHSGSALTAVVVQSGNVLPVADASLSLSGYSVTLTDLSYDSDYNMCGHTGGPGKISILWGNGNARTEGPLDLTDSPSNQVYSYMYPTTSKLYVIKSNVMDNASTTWVQWTTQISLPVPANSINISGRLAPANGGPLSKQVVVYLKQNGNRILYATTNSQGDYRFFGAAPGCYNVEPQVGSTGYIFNPVISAPVCTNSTDVNFVVTTP